MDPPNPNSPNTRVLEADASPAVPALPTPIITIGPSRISFAPPSGENSGKLIVDPGTTIQKNGPAATIGEATISIGDSGVTVSDNSGTRVLPVPEPNSDRMRNGASGPLSTDGDRLVSIAGQDFVVDSAGNLVKPGTTISAGDAVTISGTAVRVGADGRATVVDADGKTTVMGVDGVSTIMNANGETTIMGVDGKTTMMNADSKTTILDTNGVMTISDVTGITTVKYPSGTTIITNANGLKTIIDGVGARTTIANSNDGSTTIFDGNVKTIIDTTGVKTIIDGASHRTTFIGPNGATTRIANGLLAAITGTASASATRKKGSTSGSGSKPSRTINGRVTTTARSGQRVDGPAAVTQTQKGGAESARVYLVRWWCLWIVGVLVIYVYP